MLETVEWGILFEETDQIKQVLLTVLLKDVIHQDDAAVKKAVDAIAIFPQAEIQLYVFFADVNAATVTGALV